VPSALARDLPRWLDSASEIHTMATPIEGTHQHAKSGKAYTYRAEYSTDDDGNIRWSAEVVQDGQVRLRPEGVLATQSPAAETIAPPAVMDAVVKAIDAYDDGAQGI
jgi:hypothetical protein